MKTKKLLSLLMAAMMVLSLSACGGGDDNSNANGDNNQDANANGDANANENNNQDANGDANGDANNGDQTSTGSDLQYIKDKGTLVIGITEFEPMDYQDADGKWVGFDADMASAFAESLGVTPTFQLIDWDSKVMELEGKTIDVVWNGMTLTKEVLSSMECTNPYFDNAQVVIVPADKAADYQTVDSVQNLSFAVETGSAALEQAKEHNFTYTEVADQATALMEVNSGTSDAAIIDYLMAVAMTGEGTGYENLTFTTELNSEQYGVGFRKGSDMAATLNEFLKTSYADGTMKQIADNYKIADKLIAQ